MIPTGSEWNNGITRRSFLKRTGGVTAATIIAWNSSALSARATEPPTAGGSNKNYIWIVYKFTQNTPLSVTGSGSTPGAALADLNEKLQTAGAHLGYSTMDYNSGIYDVSNMTSVYEFSREDGSVSVPQWNVNSGKYTITVNLKKDMRFRITRWK